MVKELRLTVLAEDSVNTSKLDLTAKHGLCILAETKKPKVSLLMDTGPSPDIVLQNAETLGVDLKKIGAVFLSHGHYDHTGGLVGILKHVGKKVPVIAHPRVFDIKLALKPSLISIGFPSKLSEVEAAGGVMLLARNPVTLAKGVMTSGEIGRETPCERVEDFWTVDEGNFKEDTMPDDQALIFSVEGKGLTIVSGCAHSGIVNTMRQAQKVTGFDKIGAVLGGFHLEKADDKRIESTLKEFLKVNPEVVGPCHCTGTKAIRRLAEALGERCRRLRTGDTIEL